MKAGEFFFFHHQNFQVVLSRKGSRRAAARAASDHHHIKIAWVHHQKQHSASHTAGLTSSHDGKFYWPDLPAGNPTQFRWAGGTSVRALINGGGRWIRTIEGVSQQIYSLPSLAT